MTSNRNWLAILGTSLLLAACADPGKSSDPHARSGATAQNPPSHKPGRMNSRGKVSSISLEKFFALQQSGKALIYDARPAFVYRVSHIPGAINLPRGTTDEQIAAHEGEIKSALAAGKTIVTYCTSATCGDAHTLADHISGLGHPVSIFLDGWHAWTEAELPTE